MQIEGVSSKVRGERSKVGKTLVSDYRETFDGAVWIERIV